MGTASNALENAMIKVMIFARRKPGLDRETFISLYETTHLDLADRFVAEGVLSPMVDYRRNYLLKDDEANIGITPEFDVVTEAWFRDQASFAANREATSRPEIARLIFDDMNTFLDLSSLVYVVVDERRGTKATNSDSQ